MIRPSLELFSFVNNIGDEKNFILLICCMTVKCRVCILHPVDQVDQVDQGRVLQIIIANSSSSGRKKMNYRTGFFVSSSVDLFFFSSGYIYVQELTTSSACI